MAGSDQVTEERSESEGSWVSGHPWPAFVLMALVAVSTGLLWWFWRLPTPAKGADVSDHGAFGDAFAPVVGLFSSLALGAAVLSVFIQREELRLQREEMRAARVEAEEHRKAAQQLAQATLMANALAAERFELERESQRHTLMSQIIAVRAEVQGWDEIALGGITTSEKWATQLHFAATGGPFQGQRPEWFWIVERRMEAAHLLESLETELDQVIDDLAEGPDATDGPIAMAEAAGLDE